MRRCNPGTLFGLLGCSLGAVPVISSPAFAEDISARVLARYPTRAQLLHRINEVRRSNQEAFTLAVHDFGQAIRVSRSLKGPPWPGKASRGIPIMSPKPKLYALKTRADWESDFRMADELSPGSEWVEFYRGRLDELTIDDSSPALREVLIDVLLNGWNDWTHWDNKKLLALREDFPELHRVYAIRELRRLKAKEIGGVLLELLTDPDIVPDLLTVSEAVVDLVDPKDAFAFVLDVYLKSDDPVIRQRMERSLPGFSARAGKEETVKEVWRPFLESEIPLLRFEARIAFDLPVPGPFVRHDIQQRWVAENDPDRARREDARKHVEARALRQQIRERQAQEKP